MTPYGHPHRYDGSQVCPRESVGLRFVLRTLSIEPLNTLKRGIFAVSGALLFAISGLFLAYGGRGPSGYRSVEPPVTTAVPVARFAQRYYVSPKGSDSNDGSDAHPCATISRAGT